MAGRFRLLVHSRPGATSVGRRVPDGRSGRGADAGDAGRLAAAVRGTGRFPDENRRARVPARVAARRQRRGR
ncbi:hypothetical protein DIE08_13965 [Burkholderia sp. Bp9004]|nr:hypothetical protein DIE08_13965 [Burkholderia sp. Bp9004]